MNTQLPELPLWLSILVTAFLLWGAGLSLLGCVGLLRFTDFYERIHMPTLCTTWGIGGVIVASLLLSTFYEDHTVWNELLITVFMILTTPATLMMIAFAASQRDNTNDWSEMPRKFPIRQPEAPWTEEEEVQEKKRKKKRS
ncbi:MAG: Monovalent cation/H+ antiporter subunit G [Candidatus Tokpelaia hoelldobleri]|uniref:Monovalent cation/H+ antiporter subunit G n=1 Tax=Candidatus Tokpelaia hoelldobleri TaxID=1902579 RepID=A0A1U9JSD6_9HYPH|nr:MAG: Monovalent cation/H+ antiporter subunit G [Candidatus Tokpelaia hoelldoblerii]